ncbi:Uncharacterised protein [Bordetella pertussis]|nr:Uncharacterised protein [Bordetella pertussis]
MHKRATSATSSVECANTTASGSIGGYGDSSRPWCSRTACAIDRRSPKRAFKASRQAGGTGRRNASAGWGAFMASTQLRKQVPPFYAHLPTEPTTLAADMPRPSGQDPMHRQHGFLCSPAAPDHYRMRSFCIRLPAV